MLAWIMVADSIVLLTGIVPIAVAAGARAAGALAKRAEPDWHELSLAAAAILAGVFGAMAPLIIRAAGGYRAAPVPGHIVGLDRLPGAARVTFHAAFNIFGANVVAAHSALELAFAVLHLAGAALAAWAACLAALRFFRARDLLVPAFAVAIAVNLAAFLFTAQALAATREIAAVLPLGAVLAGRLLGPRLLGLRLLGPRLLAGKALRVPLRSVLAVVAAGYLAALGYGAAQPAVPAMSEPLATWLVAHGYSHGLAGYWQAGSTTLDAGARRQRELGGARPRRAGGPGALGDQHAAVRPVPAVRQLRRGQELRHVLHPVAAGRRGTHLRPAPADLRRGALHDHDLARQPAHAARPAPRLRRSAGPLLHEVAQGQEGGPGRAVRQRADRSPGLVHPVQHVRAGLLHGVMAAQQGERLGQQGLVGQVRLVEQPAQPRVRRGLRP